MASTWELWQTNVLICRPTPLGVPPGQRGPLHHGPLRAEGGQDARVPHPHQRCRRPQPGLRPHGPQALQAPGGLQAREVPQHLGAGQLPCILHPLLLWWVQCCGSLPVVWSVYEEGGWLCGGVVPNRGAMVISGFFCVFCYYNISKSYSALDNVFVLSESKMTNFLSLFKNEVSYIVNLWDVLIKGVFFVHTNWICFLGFCHWVLWSAQIHNMCSQFIILDTTNRHWHTNTSSKVFHEFGFYVISQN